MKGFQDRFNECAATLQATDEATLMERQSVLGDLLSELAKRGKKYTTFSQFKRAAMAGGYRMHYTKGELQWDTDPDLRIYFADIDGQPLLVRAAVLRPPPRRPAARHRLPLLPALQIRTRFFRHGDKIEHEVLVESPNLARTP